MESVTKLFDAYNREARVFPATLMLVSALVFVLVGFPKLLGEFPKNALAVLVFLAVLYLLAGVARSAGKRIEPDLLARWGGWPTTTLLRHADTSIDGVTKARYHRVLTDMCPDVVWPSADDEAADPDKADVTYSSAIAVLRARRRGDEHTLVHRENAAYGFRRNMLGLRPLAIVIALLTALGAGALLAAQLLSKASPSAIAKIGTDPRYVLLLVAEVAIACVWVALVRPSWVRHAANDYANALLRSLDVA